MLHPRRHTDSLPPEDTLAARLRALGAILDRYRFSPEGLCLLETEGGFVVTGFRAPDRGAAYGLVQHTITVSAAEVIALIRQDTPS